MLDRLESLMVFAATRKDHGPVPTSVPTTRDEVAALYTRSAECHIALYLRCATPLDHAFIAWFNAHEEELNARLKSFGVRRQPHRRRKKR